MSGNMDLNSIGTLGSGADLSSLIGSFGSSNGGVNPTYAIPQIGPINLPTINGFGSNGGAVTGAGGLFGGVNDSSKIGTWGKGGKIDLGLQGLQTIGGLIGAFGSLSLANKQFNLQKDVLNTNLKNQIQSYNTALEDKARSRAAVEGQTPEQQAAYIAANKATR
jgi:hypothetical protein